MHYLVILRIYFGGTVILRNIFPGIVGGQKVLVIWRDEEKITGGMRDGGPPSGASNYNTIIVSAV